MANKVQCAGGHWFDISKFRYCPYCGLPAQPVPTMAPQMQSPVQAPGVPSQLPQYGQPQMQAPQGYYAQTGYYAPAAPSAPFAPASPFASAAPFSPGVSAAPVSAAPASEGADTNGYLPVGWLVGVEGAAKGRTYVIRENRNFVGSGSGMDITIDDALVSKDRHAVITYVPVTKTFYAQSGMSRELYYVNGSAVLECTELHAGDVITIGSSKLSLLPLCNESFGWD